MSNPKFDNKYFKDANKKYYDKLKEEEPLKYQNFVNNKCINNIHKLDDDKRAKYWEKLKKRDNDRFELLQKLYNNKFNQNI